MRGAIMLDKRMEVRIVGADHVLLHVDADHRRRRRDRKNVKPRLDVRGRAILLYKVVKVLDWAAEQLAFNETVHYGVIMEGLGQPTRRPSTYLATVATTSSKSLVDIVLIFFDTDFLLPWYLNLILFTWIRNNICLVPHPIRTFYQFA
jgi:hypothetical protein